MASFNKVVLVGNLTRDPELRHISGGSAVTDLGLAVNHTWTTKDGEKREEVLFVDVTVWKKTAENCCQYLAKGKSVLVEGRLKLETWDDKTTGEKRSKIKVEGERVQFLSPKSADHDDNFVPPAAEPVQTTKSYGRPAPRPVAPPPPENDDDIAF